MSHYFRVALVPLYLFLCLIFGGASAAGYWANLFLQLIGLVLIFWALLDEAGGARGDCFGLRADRPATALAPDLAGAR